MTTTVLVIQVGIGLTKELVTGSDMCVYIQQCPSSRKDTPAGTMRLLLPLIPPTSLRTEISTHFTSTYLHDCLSESPPTFTVL